MGGGPSQEDYESHGLKFYENALRSTCVLPDVGIDESLLKYSGINSSAELQSYSNELLDSVPDYIEKLGSAFGALSAVPNAVGLGALIISMIMEIAMKSSVETSVDSYSLLRRVFDEEKASSVRDTMSEYLKRHRMFITNDQQLLVELRIMERQLSGQLTILRNSLLHDGQMSARGFKIWVNGASFHIQMLIHQARLDIQAGKPASECVSEISGANNEYLQDLGRLMEKFKTYMTSSTSISLEGECFGPICRYDCYLENTESKCGVIEDDGPCDPIFLVNAYVNHVFSKYEPILSLRGHFSNIKNNTDSLINQRDTFTLPSQ